MLLPIVKASLVIIVLLGFYKLFLERESFFKANRVYLLACLALACILPFIALPKLSQHQGFVTSVIESKAPKEVQEIDSPIIQRDQPAPKESETRKDLQNERLQDKDQSELKAIGHDKAIVSAGKPIQNKEKEEVSKVSSQSDKQVISTPPSLSWLAEKDPVFWLVIIYVFGVVIMSLRLFSQVASILKSVLRNRDKIEDEDGTIVNIYADIAPCSFFKYIFINPTKYDYQTYEQIITHEKIHVRKHHSIDLLLAEVVGILLWFNPFVWVLRKEIEKNVEYQTDDILVNGSSDVKENYQMNLVKIASANKPLAITTNYNQSLIKQRILKMNNRKSNNHSYWKYAFVAPLIFVLLVFLNKPNIGFAKSENAPQRSNESVLTTIPLGFNKGDVVKAVAQAPIAAAEEAGTLDSPFANNCTALNEAVRDQDLEEIKTLLKKQDPNCADPDPGYEIIESDDERYTWRRSYPRTPLANAARIGDLEIGKLLVKAGAEADFDRGDHGSPMTESANRGHLDFLKFMVAEGADLNYMTDGEGTALHCGARNGHLDIVKYALEQGVALDRQNDGQGTALNGAARNGHLETVAFLIEKGADIDKQNDGQGSALNAAARNGHVEVAELLIDKGADINAQRDGQGSALNAAARNGHTEMIALLLDKGADIDRQNDGQGSALNAAARNGHIATVELLLSKGADIDRHNDGQGSALNAAARNGHTKMVEFLISKGARIDKQTDGQGSALNAAARNGHIDTVKLLLSKGADIDRQNDGQGSALNAAARNGHLEMVKLLVEKGADVNLHSDGQGTVLSAASRNRHKDVVKFLQEKGAY